MALEGAYSFDDIGSSTVTDHSGNGRDIDLTGTNGAQVDGATVLDDGALGKTGADTISLPAALRTAMETDDRTIMCDVVGARFVWLIRFESASLDTGVFGVLSLDSGSTVISRARTQANVGPSQTITIGALAASRHNFCLTYVRATGVLTGYYDGVSVGTATFAAGTALYTGADDLNIAEWSSAGPALDNLRFFSHALTPSEVADLAGTPVSGASEVTGTASAPLGGLTVTASATRTVNAVAAASLGALTGAATATRTVDAVATAALGSLVATATAQTTVNGAATAQLGTVLAVATGRRSTTGSALAALTFLARVIVPNPVPSGRIVVAGREPPTAASGREPPRRIP